MITYPQAALFYKYHGRTWAMTPLSSPPPLELLTRTNFDFDDYSQTRATTLAEILRWLQLRGPCAINYMPISDR